VNEKLTGYDYAIEFALATAKFRRESCESSRAITVESGNRAHISTSTRQPSGTNPLAVISGHRVRVSTQNAMKRGNHLGETHLLSDQTIRLASGTR